MVSPLFAQAPQTYWDDYILRYGHFAAENGLLHAPASFGGITMAKAAARCNCLDAQGKCNCDIYFSDDNM